MVCPNRHLKRCVCVAPNIIRGSRKRCKICASVFRICPTCTGIQEMISDGNIPVPNSIPQKHIENRVALGTPASTVPIVSNRPLPLPPPPQLPQQSIINMQDISREWPPKDLATKTAQNFRSRQQVVAQVKLGQPQVQLKVPSRIPPAPVPPMVPPPGVDMEDPFGPHWETEVMQASMPKASNFRVADSFSPHVQRSHRHSYSIPDKGTSCSFSSSSSSSSKSYCVRRRCVKETKYVRRR